MLVWNQEMLAHLKSTPPPILAMLVTSMSFTAVRSSSLLRSPSPSPSLEENFSRQNFSATTFDWILWREKIAGRCAESAQRSECRPAVRPSDVPLSHSAPPFYILLFCRLWFFRRKKIVRPSDVPLSHLTPFRHLFTFCFFVDFWLFGQDPLNWLLSFSFRQVTSSLCAKYI